MRRSLVVIGLALSLCARPVGLAAAGSGATRIERAGDDRRDFVAPPRGDRSLSAPGSRSRAGSPPPDGGAHAFLAWSEPPPHDPIPILSPGSGHGDPLPATVRRTEPRESRAPPV